MKLISIQKLVVAETHVSSSSNPEQPLLDAWNRPEVSDIRRRLRVWEAKNAHNFASPPELVDYVSPGQVTNSLTRMTTSEFEVEQEVAPWNIGTIGSRFDFDERLDVGHKRSFLLPGDLVELLYAFRTLSCLNG